MDILRAVIKALWGIGVMIYLVNLGTGLSENIKFAQSAMQASQLYNEATVNILCIIAITAILILWDVSTEKSAKLIQQQTKELASFTNRIGDVLNRFEQHLGRTSTSSLDIPKALTETEQITSIASLKEDQPVATNSDVHVCSKCHAPMVIRTATKGKNQGKQFYVCSNFPKCQEVVPVP